MEIMERNCSTTVKPTIEENAPFIVLYMILGIFICFGNILTIVVVWKTPILRTVPNMYVVSLAVADLMVGIFAVPSQITFLTPSARELLDLNKTFCLFAQIIHSMSASTSIWSMAVISLDRAFYIGYPFLYNGIITANKAKMIIACTWILSLVVSSVPAYYNNWNECGDCNLFNLIPVIYQIIQIGVLVVVCIITASSYRFIFKIARSKHVRDRQPNSSRLQADMKLVKTFLMVFGLFVLCWAPILTLTVLNHLAGIYTKSIFYGAVFLSTLNSGINFFVYTVTNQPFRTPIAKLLCRKQKVEVDIPMSRIQSHHQ